MNGDGVVDGEDQDAYNDKEPTWHDWPGNDLVVAQTFSDVDNWYMFQGVPHVAVDASNSVIDKLPLNHHRARYADPAIGRWGTRDPVGNRRVSDLYEYMKGRPLGFLDPKGERVVVVAPPARSSRCRGSAMGHPLLIAALVGLQVQMEYDIGIELEQAACMEEATDVAPEPRPQPPQPPPMPPNPDLPPPPDPCPEEYRRMLQDNVDVACQPPTGPRKCTSSMSLVELLDNLRRFELCAAARDRINNECYDGGDAGHQEGANNARNGAANCREKLEKGYGCLSLTPRR
ncbi:MAG: RHS repeat-associated core domain-containing protein [Phycisphaerae bacterium]